MSATDGPGPSGPGAAGPGAAGPGAEVPGGQAPGAEAPRGAAQGGRYDGVGSAAEEAARLLTAAEQWARRRAAALLDDDRLATGSPECTTCPLCSAVAAVRHVRPEAVEHLLDAAGSLVAALRASVPASPAGRQPGVQHIDLDAPDPGDSHPAWRDPS